MPQAQADRNLLLGILAYQNAFVSREALVAGMQAWLFDKGTPLARILQNQGALDEQRRALLEALAAQHLQQHGEDAQKSLQAVSSAGSVRRVLEDLPDPDLQASLVHLVRAKAEEDSFSTQANTLGESTSAGTRFRILRPHAKGGLGIVHVALDGELNREVALKEIQDRHADKPESRSRFLLEAEITGGLEHPGIVPVYGLGTYADGRPFYAMRFIRGDSLMDAIERFHNPPSTSPTPRDESSSPAGPGDRTLQLHKLLRRLIDVCNALQYAHDRGVLHRDLKPGNIMLGKYGETLVVDWGLAKAGVRGQGSGVSKSEPRASASGIPTEAAAPTSLTEELPLRPASASGSGETVAGRAIGTPAYMSPEQAAGRLDLIGPASDVYSLGATLYCLLTGRAPFKGELEKVLKNVQRGEFVPPRQVAPWVSPALEAVCLKAMALKPQDRYASPQLLAEDIEHWLADEPVAAWPEPWTVKARRWVGKHRTLVTSAAATLLVGVVSLGLGLALVGEANRELSGANATIKKRERETQKANEELAGANKNLEKARADAVALANKETATAAAERQAREDANRARKLAEAEKKLKEDELRRSETLLYYSTFREAFHHFEKNDLLGVRAALDDCRPDLRGPEYGFLASYCRRRLRLVGAHENLVTSLALSADGKRLFSGSGEFMKSGQIKVWDLEVGKETRTLRGHTDLVTCVALSAGGQRLFSGSLDRTIKVWDLAAGKETRTLRGHSDSVRSLALSADGKRLFSASYDRTIKVWDLEAGKETRTLRGHTDSVRSLALSADGKRLFSASHDKTIKVWDLEAGKETLTLHGHTSAVSSLALSADGKRLFSASWDKTIKVWDLETGKETPTLRLHTAFVDSLALSADGKRLLSGSGDNITVWDLKADKETLTLRGHTGVVTSLALSAGGKRLFSASHDQTIKVWDLEAGQETRTLRGHTGVVGSLALSVDGKRLFSGSFDQTIKVWDPEAGQETRTLRGHTGYVYSLALSADGKRLFSGSHDNIKVWDLEAGKETRALHGHTNQVESLALSADGKRLFSGSYDQTIKVWDLEAGKETRTLRGHTNRVSSLALSVDGKRLFSASDDPTIKVWDLEAGKETQTLRGHTDQVLSLALSADGKRLFSGSWDKTIKVWDLEAGKETRTLRGHTGYVMSLALSADGKRLFSGSFDRTIKVWDLEAGKETLTLRGHTDQVLSLALSADGKRLFSGSWDKTIKVWDLEAPGEERPHRGK